MRVVVLSSSPTGFASYCVPLLGQSPHIEIAGIIVSEGLVQRPWQKRWRKLKKTARIGLLGALNGLRMREWYELTDRLELRPLDQLAREHGVPYETTPSLFSARTVELMKRASADLGLSLGNGYIPRRVFSVPRLGMINIHHEMLPQFQGAQSVIWQIYHGSRKTGFTIHRIDDHIDTGDILYQEEVDILFRPTLGETVAATYARLWEASRTALIKVIEDFDHFAGAAKPQGTGRSFTTPSYWQFRKIARQFELLRAQEPRP